MNCPIHGLYDYEQDAGGRCPHCEYETGVAEGKRYQEDKEMFGQELADFMEMEREFLRD